ncbi:MAG: bifunctional phosphoglucose/phosphomannose isomerase, partial [Patescibacteria group bacterium]
LALAKQFSWQPIVERPRKRKFKKIVVAGMGGSHLAADILQSVHSELPLRVHRDYGLPHIPVSERSSTLLIASSYSGNTEETLDAFEEARKTGIATAAIAIGGKIEKMARQNRVPYVQMPDTGIQPRSALGFSIKGLCALMELEGVNSELSMLARTLKPASLEDRGKKLARTLKGSIPLIYASTRNEAVAYNWKIKFNETGKIPAFYNVLPELNHNEMTGFDHTQKNAALSKRFHVLFLTDEEDHPRTQKRMAILRKLYQARGLANTIVSLRGANRWMKIFSSLILADWAAVHVAALYGAESEQVPMVEEFKKMIMR